MPMRNSSPILLVEDDQVDIMTVKRAMREAGIQNPLRVVNHGEEALTVLRDASQPRPGIILLDLNMPRMGGLELLGILKADATLKTIPVIVLTTSREDQDRLNSFSLSVAGYMIKPVDYPQFVGMMKIIHGYWSLSELPE